MAYLERISAGYRLPTSYNGLAEDFTYCQIARFRNTALWQRACKRVPKGVVCLLSALRFHELTTQAPFEVWLAIGERAWRPLVDYPPVRIVHFSSSALGASVEKHQIEGVTIPVFNPAKTVADCLKYRNKIGLDAAIEALRESWRSRRCTIDELWTYAKVCRVHNVMRPYLESIAICPVGGERTPQFRYAIDCCNRQNGGAILV